MSVPSDQGLHKSSNLLPKPDKEYGLTLDLSLILSGSFVYDEEKGMVGVNLDVEIPLYRQLYHTPP